MNRLIRPALALLALACSAVPGAALAGNVEADIDQIGGVMLGAGYKLQVREADGQRFLSVELPGTRFSILPFGCDEAGKSCKSVQFFAAFAPDTKPTLEAMNAYARNHRWGRVYLDREGDPAIEFDLDLEQGGMSEELFLDNVAYWEAVTEAYAKFVFGKE